MKNFTCTCALFVLLSTTASLASDSIKVRGKENPLRGQIMETSPSEVKINTKPVEVSVKANEIEMLSFDDEPEALTKARRKVQRGDYDEAQRMVNAIPRGTITHRQVLTDMDYLIAYSATQLALGGSEPVKSAGTLMKNFIENNPNSYHYFEANELFGDLSALAGVYDTASRYYDAAAKAPWPSAEVRMDVKRGNALLAQGKPADALSLFERVIASSAQGLDMEELKQMAQLGKASALVSTGAPDQGLKLVNGVINANKGNAELLGRAYLVQGNCYRVANKPRDAVLSYLHVDLLYSQNPQVHAETLSWLSGLWQQLNKPERARDAAARLARTYPNSRWNKTR